MADHTVVVLGGGTGGLVAARRLRRQLDPADRVAVVDHSPDYLFAASFLWVMIGTRRAGQVSARRGRLRRAGLEIRQAEAREIDLTGRRVKTSEAEIGFDRLVVVSDGELRRDNDIDYLLVRIPGVEIPHRSKTDYYDYYEAQVTRPLPSPTATRPGLAADLAFTRAHTDRPIKFSFTGPFSLSRRIRNMTYTDPADLVRALARWLNRQASELAGAGAALLQIDEPFLAGYPASASLT